MDIIDILIEFLIIYLIIYSLYYFFTIKKCKKNAKYVPAEVGIILIKHKINLSKAELYKMIKVVCSITSFILALSVILMSHLSNNIILSILIGVSLSVVLAIIIYGFIGRYYKRKSRDN